MAAGIRILGTFPQGGPATLCAQERLFWGLDPQKRLPAPRPFGRDLRAFLSPILEGQVSFFFGPGISAGSRRRSAGGGFLRRCGVAKKKLRLRHCAPPPAPSTPLPTPSSIVAALSQPPYRDVNSHTITAAAL